MNVFSAPIQIKFNYIGKNTQQFLRVRAKSEDNNCLKKPNIKNMSKQVSIDELADDEVGIDDVSLQEDDSEASLISDNVETLFEGRFGRTLASRWRNADNLRGMKRSNVYFGETNIEYILDEEHALTQEAKEEAEKVLLGGPPKALTEYIYEDLEFEDAVNFLNRERSKAGLFQKYWIKTKKHLMKYRYFQNLFPTISAQKPGKDYYVPMTAIQFILVIYVLLFFSFMERDYTNVSSESLQIRQFSALLVIVTFAQIFIILIDRYIYISKTFIKNQDKENRNLGQINHLDPESSIDLNSKSANSILYNLVIQIRHNRNSSIANKQNSLLPDEYNGFFSSHNYDEALRNSTLSSLNTSIRLKFVLQWFLVIIIHLMVFWYLPSKSNMTTQEHYYCDENFQKETIYK